MNFDYLKIFVTIFLAVIGWLVGHYFTTKRDVSNKRRELIIQHLIEAYRIMANEVSHRDKSAERDKKFEDILSDIQLFGSSHQINLVKKLIEELSIGAVVELDPLINSLRDDLRKQLKLRYIEGNIRWLRFEEYTDKTKALYRDRE